MTAEAKSLNSLLKKGVTFESELEHIHIVQTLKEKLSSPKVLASPEVSAGFSGDRPFQLITDVSADELGAVIEQHQK